MEIMQRHLRRTRVLYSIFHNFFLIADTSESNMFYVFRRSTHSLLISGNVNVYFMVLINFFIHFPSVPHCWG